MPGASRTSSPRSGGAGGKYRGSTDFRLSMVSRMTLERCDEERSETVRVVLL